MKDTPHLPRQIRVSAGSAIVLGLANGKLDAAPTTAYLMTYRKARCNANCAFCPQARESKGRADMLSRVSWPSYPTRLVIDGISRASENGKAKRVCIQALNYPQVFDHLVALVKTICSHVNIPISVSCQPLTRDNVVQLTRAGIERIGIPLDAPSEEIFTSIKGVLAGGPYDWKTQWQSLNEAVSILGRGKVSTHFIVGLGETERQMVEVIQRCIDMGVLPGLFAFTPIPGTALAEKSQPPLAKYRRIQIARYLILHGIARCEGMSFDDKDDLSDFGVDDETLLHIAKKGEAFRTSGCPDCNRPYYNEKPTGPLYNYPNRLTKDEVRAVEKQLGLFR